jgi:excinuclease ABC subunit C
MVVFVNGLTDKTAYRKFKLHLSGNDDFAHMYETLKRRLRVGNLNQWGRPDLMLIDGGRGQLAAAIKARDESGCKIPLIGLAKKYEEIVISKKSSGVTLNNNVLKTLKGFKVAESAEYVNLSLPVQSHIVKLLQRIRDESHRFAISYHNILRIKRQTTSVIDEIPGIGPLTKKKLLRSFGSIKGLKQASDREIINAVGTHKAMLLKNYLVNT